MYLHRARFVTALLASIFVIFGCSSGDQSDVNSEPVREKVIDRYEGGMKKVVAEYRGRGVDEEMIRRITFTKRGEKKKIENLESGETRYYGEIHGRSSKQDSLKAFLMGSVWYQEIDVGDDTWSTATIYEENESHTILANDGFSRRIVNRVEYKDGLKLKIIREDSVRTENLKITGPNEISFNKEGDTNIRVEASELEIESLKSAVKELRVE